MKTRACLLLAGLAALMGLSSCLESHQTINLKKDGSGTIVEENILGAQMVAMMQLGAGQPGQPDPFAEMMDEAQYKAKAASYGEGVTFQKVEAVNKNGGKGAKVTYAFKDINTVTLEPGSGLDDMGPGEELPDDAKAAEPLKFAYADGKLTVTFPDPPKGEQPEVEDVDEALDPQAQQMMQMFKGMRISAKINVEPGIKATDASYQDGDTITLMDVDFGKILENPDGMKVLQKLDMEDRAAMEKTLKGVKGVKMETKEKIEITVK